MAPALRMTRSIKEKLPFLSKCTGFLITGEDSSEVSILLVENYNYDCSSWSSDRLGIFDPCLVTLLRAHLFR